MQRDGGMAYDSQEEDDDDDDQEMAAVEVRQSSPLI